MCMRHLSELITREDPAMPQIRTWLRDAQAAVEVLACTPADGARALVAAQVTTRSPLGALCHETGGILVDHGWLRILGAGCARLPRALMDWNDGRVRLNRRGVPLVLLVADDVIGGFFAVNGGGLRGVDAGHVAYLAPDTLDWESLGMTYSEFLCWSWSGQLATFAADHRWPGWQEEVSALSGAQAFSIMPSLFAQGPPIAERDRRAVPIAEIWGTTQAFRTSLGIGSPT